MIKPQPFTATVVSNEYIAAETRKTIFKIDESFHIQFSTGQFFNLKVEDKIMRAYSIASSSSRLPEFELCVKVVPGGKGSGYIDNMKQGESIEFMGPFGHFGQKSPQKKTLMIATGTGIAPMKAICDELSEQQFQNTAQLIFGVSTPEYASYHSEFSQLSEQFPPFDYQLFVSRPPEGFVGNIGRVTSWVQEQSPKFFENTEVLICGNPAMVKEVKKMLLEEKKVDKEDIIVEAF